MTIQSRLCLSLSVDWVGKKVLITGAAGFIGFHLARRLLKEKAQVFGIDNLNDYYSVALKKDRLQVLQKETSGVFEFSQIDFAGDELSSLWRDFKPDYVYHLGAQAGVRYSLSHPEKYVHSNLQGFFKVLEAARQCPPKHLIYATSSSVYGNSTKAPFSTQAPADRPISFYAATKRSNELMAYTYNHLYKIPLTGLRFFTVYGSWGRPDMAYFSFTKAILEGQPLTLFAPEKQKRDFTHVSDIVESLIRMADKIPQEHRLLNIGASSPVPLLEFVSTLESVIGKKAHVKRGDAQPGDVESTFADVAELETLTGYRPQRSLKEGLEEFFQWYQSYYPAK